MHRAHRSSAIVGIAAVALSTLTLAIAPAHASETTGIGSGRAVIRLDAPTATVVKTGKHSYRMVLPQGTTGQWMGERANANGTLRSRVGDLTAAKLAKRWTNFRYGSTPVYTTLAWNSQSTGLGAAVVMLSQPKITDEGVRFDFTSRFALPKTMRDVSVNISRAPRKGDNARSLGVQQATVTGTLVVWINATSEVQVFGRIYDSSGSNCWGGANGTKLAGYQSVGSGTCAGLAYADTPAIDPPYDEPYGVITDFSSNGKSAVYYEFNVTPPGQNTFAYAHEFTF